MDNREAYLERFTLLSKEAKERTFQAFVGQFTKLEDMSYIWIENMRHAKVHVPPFLAIAKAKTLLTVFPFRNPILRQFGNG